MNPDNNRLLRHIDVEGLAKGYDIADLLATGISDADLLAWFKGRVREGNYTEPPKPKAATKAAPKRIQPPEPATMPAPPSNVVPILAEEDDPGIPPEYSEDSLAEGFSETYENTCIFVKQWNAWLIWEDNRWQTDETARALDLARKICKKAAVECQLRRDLGAKAFKIANTISARKTFVNVEQICRTDRRHTAVPAQFDADPWILNTPGGVVDLRNGDIRPARRDDFASKCAAVAPGGKCPTWLTFLEQSTDGDTDMQAYLARVAGYCLTGSTAEQVFWFVYGTGGNGKGTFINTIDRILADYARVAQMETFTESRYTKHASELAYFAGSRLVTAQETEEGKRWNESRVKAMTGGDPITANFMHQNPFTFFPQFKLLFAGNHRPSLRNVDEAIKRRLHLIPFTHFVQPKDRDPALPAKLQAEYGGILAWAIRGCLEWQEQTLAPPERVLATTQEYFEGEDVMGQFFDECCLAREGFRTPTTRVYAAYVGWAKRNGEFALPRKRWSDLMELRNYPSVKMAGEMVIENLTVKVTEGEPDWRNE